MAKMFNVAGVTIHFKNGKEQFFPAERITALQVNTDTKGTPDSAQTYFTLTLREANDGSKTEPTE